MLETVKRRMAGAVVLLALSTTLAACGIGGGSGGQGNSQLVDTGVSQSTGSGSGTATPTRSSQSRADPTGTPGPSAPANVKVSANEVTMGNLVLTISVNQARRMVVENAAPAAPTAQTQGAQGQGAAAQQEMVLGVQSQRINKNLDSAQGPPPDPKDGQGDYIRHVDIQVKDKNTGQVVPYLAVTMDILRDGRPLQYDLGLVPEIQVGGTPDQMHYGNNVAFPGKGRYQLFVRMPSNPLLGNGAPPYAQFDVTIE